MASGGHSSPATAHLANAAPRAAAATPAQQDAVQSKRDLTSWWKTFKRGNAKLPENQSSPGIFGVPLQQSIRYANVAISLFNDEGQSYIYGYVPIVVAKCGVYLKEKATDVEGIFRLSGSEKRIKELRVAFDSPDRYGKGLDWTGYTVHDAANILRRYFNQLPEPIIPLEFYELFRHPLRNHQAQAVGAMESQGPELGNFDADKAIRSYQRLITELPPLNRQLLLYILDLLAVFASKSDLNKMTTANLAAIFQPGLLSHPQHDMAPQEYRLSQDVLIFLIENQDSFLIGMHGTGVDEKTVKDVESGAQTPRTPSTPTTPARSRTVLGRSSSTASAGADSVRKWGNMRRNVSVTSKTSKRSASGPGPVTPVVPSPATPTGSAVNRSNTVPSRRSTGPSPRFSRERSAESPTPSPGLPPLLTTALHPHLAEELTPTARSDPMGLLTPGPVAPPEVVSASSSEATTPQAARNSDTSALLPKDYSSLHNQLQAGLTPPAGVRRDVSSERSISGNSSVNSRAFRDVFKQPPSAEKKKPNKLKKRIPGSALSSAQSSAHDLGEEQRMLSPTAPTFPTEMTEGSYDTVHDRSAYATAQTSPRALVPQRTQTDATLKPTVSPTHSYASRASVTDASEADTVDDNMAGAERAEKKKRWRFSTAKPRASEPAVPAAMSSSFGSIAGVSTTGSAGKARGSFQDTSPPTGAASMPPEQVMSDSEDKKKGLFSRIRGKLAQSKDKEGEKRARTPSRNRDRSGSRHSVGGTGGEGAGAMGKVRSLDSGGRQASQVAGTGAGDVLAEVDEKGAGVKSRAGAEA